LTSHGSPGTGGTSGGSGGQGNGGDGGQGGDVPLGLGGDYGGVGGVGGVGSVCDKSPDCMGGLYCYVSSCAASSYGNCEPLMTADGGCSWTDGPVCGCDGKKYADQCQAYAAGTTATPGACPLPIGTPCTGGDQLGCGIGEYCQVAACNGAMGACQTMPNVATCAGADDPVCGCDDLLYDLPCAAAANGTSIRNTGTCPPLPTGPCSSQADCGGDSYANLVTCVPATCDSPAGTCTPVGTGCQITLEETTAYQVCGCDGQTYNDPCAARFAGVTVAHQGACETP
jgi:hypothetical protein